MLVGLLLVLRTPGTENRATMTTGPAVPETEVFAAFGRAAHAAQALEYGFATLLLCHRQLQDQEITQAEFAALDEVLSRKTMGSLLQEMERQGLLQAQPKDFLMAYVRKRNQLMHRFFFLDNDPTNQSASARKAMLDELVDLQRYFLEGCLIVNRVFVLMQELLGVSEEDLNRQVRAALNSLDTERSSGLIP
jgi:hypothetical protein